MTFSYAGTADGGTIETPRDLVRLEIGDTNANAVLLQDEELDAIVKRCQIVTVDGTAVNVLRAAAEACDALAGKFARKIDFATDGQSFSLSQKAGNFRLMAAEFRKRAGGRSQPLVSSVNTAVGDNLPNYGGTPHA